MFHFSNFRKHTYLFMCTKFNVGTVLRKSFGSSLRASLNSNPELFDRITIMQQVIPDLKDTATKVIDLLGQ